ncbi:MAG: hypothetical protein K6B45_04695 [Bacteroidaceae bacterium]|nr:hypothetical protein [Bacteroidaceae bacterium]
MNAYVVAAPAEVRTMLHHGHERKKSAARDPADVPGTAAAWFVLWAQAYGF